MKNRLAMLWSGLLLITAGYLAWLSRKVEDGSGWLLEKAILPCPKCGGEGEDYFETGMESMRIIRCEECGFWGEQESDDLPKAISLWNRAR